MVWTRGRLMARLFRAATFAIFIMLFLYAGNAFAAGGTCPSGGNYANSSGQLVTLAGLGVTNCYYIAANGSDSNGGTSESSPWAHLPGMPTCTATCAATTPAAGQGFILRGGDTWGAANLGVTWNWGGTATNPIYIGVDPTWYSGSSWSRPVWTCAGATCTGDSGYFFGTQTAKAYNILDNIEMTGLFETSSSHPNFVNACGQNQIFENIYIHGWSSNLTGGSASEGFHTGCGAASNGTTVRYSVMDGSDTAQNTGWFNHSGMPVAYGNVMRYVVTGIDGCGDNWHDNLFEYMTNQVGGGHQDGLYQYGTCDGSTALIYNNVIRHTTFSGSGGAVKLWLQGNNPCGALGTPLTDCIGYAFNNVVYDNLPGNIIDTGAHFAYNYGTWYIFNNTFDCGTDSTPGNCSIGDNGNAQDHVAANGQMALHSINNHWITTNTSSICCSGPAGSGSFGSCYSFTCSETSSIYQTESAASAEGYVDTGNYAFQPVNASGSTVGTGTNESSLCGTISGINAQAGAACMDDTGYACSYDSTNHAVSCPMKAAVIRPAGAWDVGAYQLTSTTQASAPQPPQGLAASVQ